MGMYDNIDFEVACPRCGTKITGFQSKNGPCELERLKPWEVENFYSSCPNQDCGTRVTYYRKPDNEPQDWLNDYVQTVEVLEKKGR